MQTSYNSTGQPPQQESAQMSAVSKARDCIRGDHRCTGSLCVCLLSVTRCTCRHATAGSDQPRMATPWARPQQASAHTSLSPGGLAVSVCLEFVPTQHRRPEGKATNTSHSFGSWEAQNQGAQETECPVRAHCLVHKGHLFTAKSWKGRGTLGSLLWKCKCGH